MADNSETTASVNGVPGRRFARHAWPHAPHLWSTQTWISERRSIRGYGKGAEMQVEMRFDDNCKNGHSTFAITAEVTTPESRRRRDIEAGGCLHDDIARVFPELAPLIQWHLCSQDGPMHYLSNTVYLAGDRDCHGLRKGEKRQLRNGKTGEPAWQLVAISDTGEETEIHEIERYKDGFDRPAHRYTLEYRPWYRVGEGKARELESARHAAIWPEATDAQLMSEPDELHAALAERLPELVDRFRAAIEGAGFAWSAN